MHVSLPLDVAYGGEFPGGKVVEVFGDSESAKTMIGLMFTKAYEDYGHETLYMDINGNLTEDNFRQAGIKKVNWARPDSSEAAFAIIESLRDHVGLIVLDTVSALSSEKATAGQDYRGTVNKAMRRVLAHAKDSVCVRGGGTILVLNQLHHGNHGSTTSAFKSLLRFTDIRIETNTIFKRKTEHLIGVKVERSKPLPMWKTFRLHIRPGEGFDHGIAMYYTLGNKKLINSGKGGSVKLKGGAPIGEEARWESRTEAADHFNQIPSSQWVEYLREQFHGDKLYI